MYEFRRFGSERLSSRVRGLEKKNIPKICNYTNMI